MENALPILSGTRPVSDVCAHCGEQTRFEDEKVCVPARFSIVPPVEFPERVFHPQCHEEWQRGR